MTAEPCQPGCGSAGASPEVLEEHVRCLYRRWCAVARIEPVTWDAVQEVQRLGRAIDHAEALLEELRS